MDACVDVCLWVQMLRNKGIKAGYPCSSFSQSRQEAETRLTHTAQRSESILHGALRAEREGVQTGQEGSGKAFWKRWH